MAGGVKQETLFAGSFHRGVIADTMPHLLPPGAVADANNMLLHVPGVATKRGGYERHSAEIGSGLDSVAAVATIHIPTRVVAVADGNLYDVTSENSPQADLIDACYTPRENPPLYVDRLVFCDPAAAAEPLKVYWDTGTSAIVVAPLFSNSPPTAMHSVIWNGIVVLGRDDTYLNRVWWWPDPDLEPDIDTAEVFNDFTNEVTGLAACSGTLLVFSPVSIERVLGSVPYGRPGSDLVPQPFAAVGTTDARSIVHVDEAVVFADKTGVWVTNGSGGPDSLTRRRDGSGIQKRWEALFEPGEIRQLIGGLLDRDHYKIDILDADNSGLASFLCYLPTGAWQPVSNSYARMYAQGRDENEYIELYAADAVAPYVEKLGSMLRPSWDVRNDGDGTVVEGYVDVVFGDAGPLKKMDGGRVTYELIGEPA